MMHPMPLLAELGSIEKVIITALAVAGGFLAGFLLTSVIARLLAKFVWKKEPPEKLIRITRFAGGVCAAIIVYMLLQGDGGLGLGGRGGGNSNDKKGNNNSQNPPVVEDSDKDPKKEEPKLKDGDPKNVVLAIYLLRYDSPQERFYRIGKDGKAMTLTEILERIDKLLESKKQSLVQVDIEVADPEYAVLAVSRLEAELNDRGVKSTRPIIKKPASKN